MCSVTHGGACLHAPKSRNLRHLTFAHAKGVKGSRKDDRPAGAFSQPGQHVALELSVDPAILGGLVVKVGSRQVDGSIRTKLNNLALAMKG